MDDRTMSGVLSEKSMKRIVEASNKAVIDRIAALENALSQQRSG